MWGTRKTNTITKPGHAYNTNLKTTEYSWEPKQKQVNWAQVIEISDRNHCVPRTGIKQQEQNYMTNIMCTKDSDRNHSALRTSKQHERNKMTDVSSR